MVQFNSAIYSESMGANWWHASDKDIFKEIFLHVNFLETNQSHRNAENIKNMRLYGNYDILGIK